MQGRAAAPDTVMPFWHRGVVADMMVGVAGLVYVVWERGAVVHSGHYDVNCLELWREEEEEEEEKAGGGAPPAVSSGELLPTLHHGCDADPARRKSLLKWLGLQGW